MASQNLGVPNIAAIGQAAQTEGASGCAMPPAGQIIEGPSVPTTPSEPSDAGGLPTGGYPAPDLGRNPVPDAKN